MGAFAFIIFLGVLIFIIWAVAACQKEDSLNQESEEKIKQLNLKQEEEKKKSLEQIVVKNGEDYPIKQAQTVLALRISEFIKDDNLRQTFLDCFELYHQYKKKAIFSSFAIADFEIIGYHRYGGTGIYQDVSCPIITEGIPWHKILDIRMVADTPSSKVTPHYNNIQTSGGGVVCGNAILPFTSNNTITTYSTEMVYHTSGKILIYTDEGYYSFWEKDVLTAYQSLMVYWENYKKTPLTVNDQSLSCLENYWLEEFNTAYSLFKAEQDKYSNSNNKLKNYRF